jgi:hypothetical protein
VRRALLFCQTVSQQRQVWLLHEFRRRQGPQNSAVHGARRQKSLERCDFADCVAQHAVLRDMVSGMIFLVPREFAGKISKIWSSPHSGRPANPQLSPCLIRKFPKHRSRELTHNIREFTTRIRVTKPGIRDFIMISPCAPRFAPVIFVCSLTDG